MKITISLTKQAIMLRFRSKLTVNQARLACEMASCLREMKRGENGRGATTENVPESTPWLIQWAIRIKGISTLLIVSKMKSSPRCWSRHLNPYFEVTIKIAVVSIDKPSAVAWLHITPKPEAWKSHPRSKWICWLIFYIHLHLHRLQRARPIWIAPASWASQGPTSDDCTSDNLHTIVTVMDQIDEWS